MKHFVDYEEIFRSKPIKFDRSEETNPKTERHATFDFHKDEIQKKGIKPACSSVR